MGAPAGARGRFLKKLCHIKWLIFDIFYLDQLGFVGEDVTETPVTGAVRTFPAKVPTPPRTFQKRLVLISRHFADRESPKEILCQPKP